MFVRNSILQLTENLLSWLKIWFDNARLVEWLSRNDVRTESGVGVLMKVWLKLCIEKLLTLAEVGNKNQEKADVVYGWYLNAIYWRKKNQLTFETPNFPFLILLCGNLIEVSSIYKTTKFQFIFTVHHASKPFIEILFSIPSSEGETRPKWWRLQSFNVISCG